MRQVVVSPHADDETMGVGGTMVKYRGEFTVVVAAEPSVVRRAEFDAAMRCLGVEEVVWLGLPDTRVGADMAHLVRRLDDVFDTARPEVVYLPYPTMHQDHIAVYEAGMRACRFSMHDHWSPWRVMVYDDVVYDATLYPTDLRWNRFEVLSEEQIDVKVEAMQCYRSQMPSNGSHPAHGIKEIARALGASRGVRYAEQFAVVKEVVP